MQSALIVVCPAAETAVGRWRASYDRAERAGVPAHVTVLFPFDPDLDDERRRRLADAVDVVPAFSWEATGTGRFGSEVLYVTAPVEFAQLTASVVASFPDWPPYGGVHEDVVPHLTVGHDLDERELAAAEADVRAWLPFTQWVDHVELWQGPRLEVAGPGTWHRVADFPLRDRL